jgi:hypothetical protein
LLQYQCDRRQHHHGGDDELQGSADILGREAVEVAGERQHERDLHHLRRLQVDDAEIDPALRAHADRAHEVDDHQQRERDDIERIGPAQPQPDIGDGGHEHDAERHAETRRLPDRPRFGGTAGGGVQHDDADAGDSADRQDEEPADLQHLFLQREFATAERAPLI